MGRDVRGIGPDTGEFNLVSETQKGFDGGLGLPLKGRGGETGQELLGRHLRGIDFKPPLQVTAKDGRKTKIKIAIVPIYAEQPQTISNAKMAPVKASSWTIKNACNLP
jgi:hypothetical protein